MEKALREKRSREGGRRAKDSVRRGAADLSRHKGGGKRWLQKKKSRVGRIAGHQEHTGCLMGRSGR